MAQPDGQTECDRRRINILTAGRSSDSSQWSRGGPQARVHTARVSAYWNISRNFVQPLSLLRGAWSTTPTRQRITYIYVSCCPNRASRWAVSSSLELPNASILPRVATMGLTRHARTAAHSAAGDNASMQTHRRPLRLVWTSGASWSLL
jgi:hypothetical protein